MNLAEAFPNGPDAWLAQRIKDLMATHDMNQPLITQLVRESAITPTHAARAVVWELHCIKLALNQFNIVCAAYAKP